MKPLILLLIVFVFYPWVYAKNSQVRSIAELSTRADFQCIDFKPLGICPKPDRQPPIGLQVSYWQPEIFMETVKVPGDYVILEYGTVLHSLAKTVAQNELELYTGIKPLSVTSGSSSNSLSGSNLQFNDVHLYDFPFSSLLDTVLCSESPNKTLGIRYLSEIDSISWRSGDIERNLPQSLIAKNIGAHCNDLKLGSSLAQCMKSWGPLYPREGFVITPSEPVGSIVDALRSVSIAGDILPAHVVESRLDFQPNIPIDKVQMVYPTKTLCFPIGQNPSQWERDKQSKDGHYVWIYWHQRQCCI